MSQDDSQGWRAPDSARPSEPAVDSPWAVPGGTPPPSPTSPTPPRHDPGYGYGASAPGGPPPGYPPGGFAAPGYSTPHQRPPEPRPGIIALRPIGMSEIFNGAFGYIRRNPRATLGLSVIVMAAASAVESYGAAVFLDETVTLVQDAFVDPTVLDQDPETMSAGGTWSTVAGLVITLFSSMILTGLLTLVVSRAALGNTTSLGAAWRGARGRLPAVVGVTVLVTLTVLALTAAWVGFIALMTGLLGNVTGVMVSVPVIIALVAVTAWIYIRFALAVPAVVLERLGPLAAMRRSWRLMRGSWWRCFGIILLASVIIYALQQLLTIPFTVGAGVVSWVGQGAAWTLPASTGVLFLGTLLLVALSYPFLTGVNALLYLDLRMRREGLDLHLQTMHRSEEPLDENALLPVPAPTAGASAGTGPAAGSAAPGATE
ncbi:glycerophosphoryl diester phosphodiesterase membrane domain-containing protein [Spiractinospora alimapuensis]|uniref:glycerophosphoryl diester phosphodiesterase membrane domain-containing protein n=1 Tax=Spiractinospora alimapuensis TaxID=2820884 RepID=UPI001F34BFB0|nr:glycerophosphoryl diester phosphodiesterase membrane domain-containing protein [Spiractinospora alimapuensis]QVQ54362.1 glycerophosphoryl diester phosphodiesterase membrane domain-containing protein [Spiractinospora alimapuensis]